MKGLIQLIMGSALSINVVCAEHIRKPMILVSKKDQKNGQVQAFKGFIRAADQRRFEWQERYRSLSIREKIKNCDVYLFQPPVVEEGLSLFKERKYVDAARKFRAAGAAFRKIRRMRGNPATLASFYEMECARKVMDWEQLGSLMREFLPDSLLREDHQLQYEVNRVVWNGVREKNWKGLSGVLQREEWLERKMSGGLRAQVSFAHGLALEGVGQPIEALTAYNKVLVSDFAASEELTKPALLHCLRILMDQEEVKTAMKLYATEDHDENSLGMSYIREAIGLISLWEQFVGGGDELPKKYEKFRRFPSKE